jgi:hypothetical protein
MLLVIGRCRVNILGKKIFQQDLNHSNPVVSIWDALDTKNNVCNISMYIIRTLDDKLWFPLDIINPYSIMDHSWAPINIDP